MIPRKIMIIKIPLSSCHFPISSHAERRDLLLVSLIYRKIFQPNSPQRIVSQLIITLDNHTVYKLCQLLIFVNFIPFSFLVCSLGPAEQGWTVGVKAGINRF